MSDIFPDVCGKLEGESIVGEAIQDTLDLWCIEEPPPCPTPPPVFVRDLYSPSPTATAISTNSTGRVQIRDWREPIRQMLQSSNVNINIRITTKPTNKSSRSYSTPSSPIPRLLSSSSDGSLLPITLSQSLPSSITIDIPARSPGPPTPSSYRPTRTTPLSQSPVAELPPRMQARPFPRAPPVLPPQLGSTAAPPSPAPLPMPHPWQSPTVAATPAPPTACPLLETFRKTRPQGGAFSEAAPSSSRTPIAEAPSSIPIVTIISPWELIRTPKSQGEGNGGGLDEHVPIRVPGPCPQHEGTTSLASDPPAPSPPVQAQVVVSPPQTQQPKQPKQPKKWYQKLWSLIK